MFRKRIIYGCESRGDSASPYLTRYTLASLAGIEVFLHVFHRSDSDELHDHPWPFVSLILWRGYVEEVASRSAADGDRSVDGGRRVYSETRYKLTRRKRVWPGMLLFRRASHAHRVELVREKPAITLVLTGRQVRRWGFFTSAGWEHFKSYFERMGC